MLVRSIDQLYPRSHIAQFVFFLEGRQTPLTYPDLAVFIQSSAWPDVIQGALLLPVQVRVHVSKRLESMAQVEVLAPQPTPHTAKRTSTRTCRNSLAPVRSIADIQGVLQGPCLYKHLSTSIPLEVQVCIQKHRSHFSPGQICWLY